MNLKLLNYQAAFFVASSIGIKFIGFLLIPIYTFYINIEDYGILSLYDNLKLFFGFVSSLYIERSIIIYYSQRSKEEYRRLFSTTLFYIVLWNLFIVPFFSLTVHFIGIIPTSSLELIFIITVSQFIWQITTLFYAHWKNVFMPSKAALAELITYLSNVSLTLYFLIILDIGWASQLYATIIASTVQLGCILLYFSKNNKHLFCKLLNFHSIKPLVLTGIIYILPASFIIIINLIDKIVLSYMTNLNNVSLYNVASKFLLLEVIIFESLLKIYEPFIYQKINKLGYEVIRKIYSLFLIIMLFFSFGLFSFSEDLARYSVSDDYTRFYIFMMGLVFNIFLYALARFHFSLLVKQLNSVKPSAVIFMIVLIHFFLSVFLINLMDFYGVFLSGFLSVNLLLFYYKYLLHKKYTVSLFISRRLPTISVTLLFSGMVGYMNLFLEPSLSVFLAKCFLSIVFVIVICFIQDFFGKLKSLNSQW